MRPRADFESQNPALRVVFLASYPHAHRDQFRIVFRLSVRGCPLAFLPETSCTFLFWQSGGRFRLCCFLSTAYPFRVLLRDQRFNPLGKKGVRIARVRIGASLGEIEVFFVLQCLAGRTIGYQILLILVQLLHRLDYQHKETEYCGNPFELWLRQPGRDDPKRPTLRCASLAGNHTEPRRPNRHRQRLS